MITTRTRYLLASLIAAGALFTGCTVEEPEKTSSTEPAATQADDPATAPAQPEPEPANEDPGIAKIGGEEWFTYEDGLEVQVTKAVPYTLGEYAMVGNPGDPGVIITVTIKNGTGAPFDTSLMDVLVSYGPNGRSAEWDYEEAGFEGSVAPGRNATAKYDFGVIPANQQDQLLVEVTPSWDHDPSYFEGAVN